MRGAAKGVAAAMALLAVSCAELKSANPAGPGLLPVGAETSWGSAEKAAALNPGSCGYVEGVVTKRTSTAGEGTFTAICGGPVTLRGTSKGVALGTIIQITGSGTASGPDGGSCGFTLSGRAAPEGSGTFRLTYSGSSCYGPFGGSELMTSR
jgi:hypothetical protein